MGAVPGMPPWIWADEGVPVPLAAAAFRAAHSFLTDLVTPQSFKLSFGIRRCVILMVQLLFSE